MIVLSLLGLAVGIINIADANSYRPGELYTGVALLAAAPVTLLLSCVIILLADIRKALTPKTDAKDNEVSLSLTN